MAMGFDPKTGKAKLLCRKCKSAYKRNEQKKKKEQAARQELAPEPSQEGPCGPTAAAEGQSEPPSARDG
jgi:hypothetical protein